MGLFDTIKSWFGSEPARPSSKKSTQSHSGKITYFNHKKGFGFITIKEEDKQVFLHISEISGKPRKGLLVNFEIVPDSKGDRAINVVPAT